MNRASLKVLLVPLLFGLALLVSARAATEVEVPARDVLVFKDGDRLQGQLLREEGGMIVFKSDRFGEQRVSSTLAVVIKAEKPVARVAAVPPVTAVGPVAT